jgi:hypothetical protein
MVDNFAHAGGFITGVLVALVFFPKARAKRQGGWKLSQYCVSLFALAALVIYCGTGSLMLFTSVEPGEWCPWCSYITCLPMQEWFDWFPFACVNPPPCGGSENATLCAPNPAPCMQVRTIRPDQTRLGFPRQSREANREPVLKGGDSAARPQCPDLSTRGLEPGQTPANMCLQLCLA